MIESNQKVRDIPVWLTALILLLSLGGGGYLLSWYIKDKPRAKEIVKVDLPTPRGGNNWRGPGGTRGTGGTGGNPTRNTPSNSGGDGIRTSANRPNTWNVRSGESLLYVTVDRSGALELSPSYVTQSLTPDQAQLLLMRRRLLSDKPMRDHVKLTDEQLTKLKNIPDFKGMLISDDERSQLVKLFEAWRKAPSADKPKAEKEVLTTLAAIGKKQLEPTKAFDSGRAQSVKDIVSAEQLKLLQSTPPSGGATPAPKPTQTVVAPATKPTTKPTTSTAVTN